MTVTLYGKRDFAGVIKLRISKWADNLGLSRWALNVGAEEDLTTEEKMMQ